MLILMLNTSNKKFLSLYDIFVCLFVYFGSITALLHQVDLSRSYDKRPLFSRLLGLNLKRLE